MNNPFASIAIAAGYASARPPLHGKIIGLAAPHLPAAKIAVDIGCGAGLSTRAISTIARHSIGVEPVEAMMRWASHVAPGCAFLVGAAEKLPFRDSSIDLLTGAGSLNYADLNAFFPEAARVLGRSGVLLVYDFSPGRTFRQRPGLDDWFRSFQQRYPPVPYEALPLEPAILATAHPLVQLTHGEHFKLVLPMTRSAYIEYMLTETNVAAAIRTGTPESEIRSWCETSLSEIWNATEQDIVFCGYFAVLACRER